MVRAICVCLLASFGVLVSPALVDAHGIWGHVHVTGWAIENLPPGELADFFADPEVRNAAMFGAAFNDSGYFPQSGALADASRSYAEHAHWEPFIEDFIRWIEVNDPGPWTSRESQLRVAFLMGSAAHGLQDEIFDTLFLRQVGEHDGAGQEEADPASDGFLALDGLIRFEPEVHLPMDALLELFAGVNANITADVIERSVDVMTTFYLNLEFGVPLAEDFGVEGLQTIPWSAAHYLDPDVPGSLMSEIEPTALYMQAIWDRLHGRDTPDTLYTFAYPGTPRRLRSGDPATVDSWVTVVSGIGVSGEVFAEFVDDDTLESVGHDIGGTRWGGLSSWGRLITVRPQEPLRAGGWYTVRIAAGVQQMDGNSTGAPYDVSFQVACDDPDDSTCEPLPTLPLPDIDGPDPEPDPDTGPDPEPDTGPDPEPDIGPEPDPDIGPDLDSADGDDADDTTDGSSSDVPIDLQADTAAPEPSAPDAQRGGCSITGTVAASSTSRGFGGGLAVAGLALLRRRRTGGASVRL